MLFPSNSPPKNVKWESNIRPKVITWMNAPSDGTSKPSKKSLPNQNWRPLSLSLSLLTKTAIKRDRWDGGTIALFSHKTISRPLRVHNSALLFLLSVTFY